MLPYHYFQVRKRLEFGGLLSEDEVGKLEVKSLARSLEHHRAA